MFNVLERIAFYQAQKGWTEYQLAEKSGLTQSTISSWSRKNMTPSIVAQLSRQKSKIFIMN